MTRTAFHTHAHAQNADSAVAPDTRNQLRPHQREAIAATIKALAHHDRGQLHMACGTGKTRTALRLAEQLDTDLVLVLVPSLSLLAQTLREWRQHSMTPFSAIAVCSDDTVADSEPSAALADIPVPVTTDPEVLASNLAVRRPGRTVVFSTYHSGAVIAAAQTMGAPAFDLAVADEAHRTAGHPAPAFRLILDADRIRARKRVFMTATPRLTKSQAATSMDDDALYGPVMFRFSFAEAIAADLLCDYQVVVIGIANDAVRVRLEQGADVVVGEKLLKGREGAAAVAVLKAMADYGITRMVTFHGNVDRARRFATSLPDVAASVLRPREAAPLLAGHVNGEMSAGERADMLDMLRTLEPGHRRVLTNARCLTEGIDVPAIDGVAFIDPRSSYVDIVQAVGRALRKAPGKEVGTILLPVYLSADDDPETVLASSAFADVCTVLSALRDHDPALGEALDNARKALSAGSGTPRLPGNVILDLPPLAGDFHTALCTQLVRRTTRPFWEQLQRLADHIATHGKLPGSTTAIELNRFMRQQRQRRRQGKLTAEEIAALEALPGWLWQAPRFDEEVRSRAKAMLQAGMSRSAIAAQFNAEGIEGSSGDMVWTGTAINKLVTSYADRTQGATSRDVRWERRYVQLLKWTETFGALQRYNPGIPPTLTRWVTCQKSYHRTKDPRLTKARIAQLEALPGWFWGKAKPANPCHRAA